MSPEPAVLRGALPAAGIPPRDALWRSLKFFSRYRMVVAAVFLVAILLSEGERAVGSQDPALFAWTSFGYLAASFGFLLLLRRCPRAFHLQLTLQVAADILFLTLLLYASGGVKSGIAMMMLVVLAGAGLVGQGRMVLFYAALATLCLLLEQSYRVLEYRGATEDFFRTGLTSVGFFATAIAARLLARKVVANEELARKRGIELADQMRINAQVIRDMQDGVLVVDASGRLRQYNPRAAALLGLEATPPAMLAASQPALAREFLARRERGVESELVMQIPQTGRTLRVRFLPPGDGGKALVFLEDASRMQQQAQQVKLAALGRLTANMAHEIRNPLAAISHAAELLDDDQPDAGTKRLLRIIGDNTRRLNRLVSEVTELGYRDRASPERIEVREFLRQTMEELALQDPGCTARIHLEFSAPCVICFDRGHLHRVLSNLLNNALRHCSLRPGAIRIFAEAGRQAGRVALHIVDDGSGIEAAVRTEVFEPFFTTRANGTGLGLYIARELCEANGARLVLLDDAPGAHFCISCVATCLDQSKNLPET